MPHTARSYYLFDRLTLERTYLGDFDSFGAALDFARDAFDAESPKWSRYYGVSMFSE